MLFTPQIYKIKDQIGIPFIDKDEINEFLTVTPTAQMVREVIAKSLNKERLSMAETAILLNCPEECRSEILDAARTLKKNVYGNRIVLFAPLYVGNLCSNNCAYCSFASSNSLAVRKTLDSSEMNQEIDALAREGHKRLILVYGEHKKYSPEFIAQNVREVYATGKIRRVNINAAPLDVEGFKTVCESGIGTYQVFQETYDREIYAAHHLGGKKADFDYRLMAFDRAMEAGIDDVGLGVLFGLNPNWRGEVLSLIRHTNHLESCFGVGPHTISFPRMTAALGAEPSKAPISDENFLFMIAVLRLAVPYTGLILTARESAEFRSRAIEFGVSQIDGGTKLEIGGYSEEEDTQGGAQFTLTDNRTLREIISELVSKGQVPSFCTACYRKGRTGEHFMEFSVEGHIKKLCTPNAVLTLAEYLEDFAPENLKTEGYELIEKELSKMESPEPTIKKLAKIKAGERDLYF